MPDRLATCLAECSGVDRRVEELLASATGKRRLELPGLAKYPMPGPAECPLARIPGHYILELNTAYQSA
jgi:hypothetical protein